MALGCSHSFEKTALFFPPILEDPHLKSKTKEMKEKKEEQWRMTVNIKIVVTVSLEDIKLRSRNWYLRIFYHLMDMCKVNA